MATYYLSKLNSEPVKSKSNRIYSTNSIVNARKHAMNVIVDSKFSGDFKRPFIAVVEFNSKSNEYRVVGGIYFDWGSMYDEKYVGIGWLWLTSNEQYQLNPDGSIMKFPTTANSKHAKKLAKLLYNGAPAGFFDWRKL